MQNHNESEDKFTYSGGFGALKSDSTHHFCRNACTKSGSLRFSQFSGCWLILSVYILMSFDFPFIFVDTLSLYIFTKLFLRKISIIKKGLWVGLGAMCETCPLNYILCYLYLFIYVCWFPIQFLCQMLFVSFNSTTMGVTAGAGIIPEHVCSPTI
jgi:hypothetical protein